MRTFVSEHNKANLERRINQMIKQGWKQIGETKYGDEGFHYGHSKYIALMERNDDKQPRKSNWGKGYY